MPVSNARVKELARSVGADQAGITTADSLDYMQERLQRRLKEGRMTPFEENDPALRLAPGRLLKNCRSVITLAIPYAAADHDVPIRAEGPLGKVARCARGLDYHLVVENIAHRIAEKIKAESGPGINYRVLSDRSPLLERELALRCGLGRIGENCTLINSTYGSFTALGTILVDIAITPDSPEQEPCTGCGQCRQACPTGALLEPFIINPHLCLSYLTQAPGIFPPAMRPLLEKQIYGCDLCQDICPHNAGVKCSPLPEMAFSFFPAEPVLLPLLGMTQKEYRGTVGMTSAGWRGKTTLQRNTVIAVGNSRDPDCARPLVKLLENDRRPVIRLHTAWALGRIRSRQAVIALEQSWRKDPDDEVRAEAKRALEER